MYRTTVRFILPLLACTYPSISDGFEPQSAHLPQTPVARAAAITRAAMLFRQKLRAGQLSPEGVRDTPFCMDTYRYVHICAPRSTLTVHERWMFDCCRIPSIPADWSVSYASIPNPAANLGHVVVVRKNRFWTLKAEVGGVVLGMRELVKSVFSISFVETI